jgi:hypothetical protein
MLGNAERRTAGITVGLSALVIARYGYRMFGWFFVHIALPELPITSFTWLLTFGTCCLLLAIVAALIFASYRLLKRPVSDGKNSNGTAP